MDTGRLIGEVARRHAVLLDQNDPVVLMATATELAMEPSVQRMEAAAARCEVAMQRAQPQFTDTQVRQVGNQLVLSFEPVGKSIAYALTAKMLACILALSLGALFVAFGGGVWAGWGIWHVPGGLTCLAQQGGELCYTWRIPPTATRP